MVSPPQGTRPLFLHPCRPLPAPSSGSILSLLLILVLLPVTTTYMVVLTVQNVNGPPPIRLRTIQDLEPTRWSLKKRPAQEAILLPSGTRSVVGGPRLIDREVGVDWVVVG